MWWWRVCYKANKGFGQVKTKLILALCEGAKKILVIDITSKYKLIYKFRAQDYTYMSCMIIFNK
jgi:hypothetical protein